MSWLALTGAWSRRAAVSDATGDRSVTPAVWNSTDGTTWTMTLLPGLPAGQWSSPAAAWTPAGLVATFSESGQTGSIGHVWSSTDGHTWAETYVDQDGALGAAGSAGTDALLIGHSQVLRSPDGVTWTPTKAKAFDGYTVRDVVTLADGRLLAAGDYFSPMGGGGMATWIGTAEPLP